MSFPKMLPVTLSEAEIKTKAERLSELVILAVEVEDKKKAANKLHSDELKEMGKEMRGLAREVRSGEEEREVVCEERIDTGRNVVEVMRMDTGEIVAHRPMDDGDRQQELDEVNRTLDGVADASSDANGEDSVPGGIGEDEPPTETGLPA